MIAQSPTQNDICWTTPGRADCKLPMNAGTTASGGGGGSVGPAGAEAAFTGWVALTGADRGSAEDGLPAPGASSGMIDNAPVRREPARFRARYCHSSAPFFHA
jgi:hypothetical protein